jgi:hypothetical protein
MKNCTHTSKLGLLEEFCGEFFCGHYYWYTLIESRAIWKFRNFGWKFIKNVYFFSFFGAIKEKYFMYQYQMKEKEIL